MLQGTLIGTKCKSRVASASGTAPNAVTERFSVENIQTENKRMFKYHFFTLKVLTFTISYKQI